MPVVATTMSGGWSRQARVASRRSVSSASGTIRSAGRVAPPGRRAAPAARPNSSRRRAAVTPTVKPASGAVSGRRVRSRTVAVIASRHLDHAVAARASGYGHADTDTAGSRPGSARCAGRTPACAAARRPWARPRGCRRCPATARRRRLNGSRLPTAYSAPSWVRNSATCRRRPGRRRRVPAPGSVVRGRPAVQAARSASSATVGVGPATAPAGRVRGRARDAAGRVRRRTRSSGRARPGALTNETNRRSCSGSSSVAAHSSRVAVDVRGHRRLELGADAERVVDDHRRAGGRGRPRAPRARRRCAAAGRRCGCRTSGTGRCSGPASSVVEVGGEQLGVPGPDAAVAADVEVPARSRWR